MSLYIDGNQVTLKVDLDSNISEVVELLEQDLNQPTITRLNLYIVEFNEELANAFVSFFQTAALTERRFAILDFNQDDFQEDVAISLNCYVNLVLGEAWRLDLFAKISLSNCQPGLFQAMMLPESLESPESSREKKARKRNLKLLGLQNFNLWMEDAETLRRELQDEDDDDGTMTKTSLETLWLNEIIFSGEVLMELTRAFQSNSTLQDVSMGNCYLSDEVISQIVDALATSCTIQTIDFSCNFCQRRGLRALARMLSNPKCQLRSLDISDQYSKTFSMGLENLVLQEEGNDGDGGGGWVRDYRNKSLEQLNLCDNGISDDDMPSIILLLQQLAGLQELDLTTNLISDRGLNLLAQDIVPSRLRILRLSKNPITNRSSKSVINLLETQPELGVLTTGVEWSCSWSKNESDNTNVDSDDDNGDGARILNMMDANLAGRVLLRQPEGARPVPLAAWSYILFRVNFLSRIELFSIYQDDYIPFDRDSSVFFLLPVLFASRQRSLRDDRKEEKLSTDQAQAQVTNLKSKYDADN